MNALGHYEKSSAATAGISFGVQCDIECLTCRPLFIYIHLGNTSFDITHFPRT